MWLERKDFMLDKIKQIKNILEYDQHDDYIMTNLPSLDTILELKLSDSVLNKIKASKFVDLSTKKISILDIKTKDDLNLFVDLYIGTIFNNCFTDKEVVNLAFEFTMNESFLPLQEQFKNINPVLKWKEHYFNIFITKYNELVVGNLENYTPSNETVIFDLTI